MTFVENHDTIRIDPWPFPSDKVLLCYVYILTPPGTPCILSLLLLILDALKLQTCIVSNVMFIVWHIEAGGD